MRLTIKYLQEQLERANEDKNKYYRLWRELEDEKKDKMIKQYFEEWITRSHESKEVLNLTRIIHAMINPELLVKEAEMETESRNRYK